MIDSRRRLLSTLVALFAAGGAAAAGLDTELDTALAVQTTASQSQARIDALDDETRLLRAELVALTDTEAAWREATATLDARLQIQTGEIAALAARAMDAERTAEQILPLMAAMIQTLERFILMDLPFDRPTRLAYARDLEATLVRPDLGAAEKFRRVAEAYQREVGYGYDIRATRGQAHGTDRFVDLLRLGRTAYYFRSLDGSEAGVWDRRTGTWMALGEKHAAQIGRALSVVRGETRPEFLTLPLVTPATGP